MAIRRIVILGGGVAGWMSALALGRALAGCAIAIDLVETEGPDHSIGPFGPGESTLPAFHKFLGDEGVDEDALLRASRGTFALGAAFSGWADRQSAWFLPFGDIGVGMGTVAFSPLVARLRAAGHPVRPTDFSLAAVAAAAGRFARPSLDRRSVLSSYGYGLHLDKAGFAGMCRTQASGVTHHAAPFARAIRVANGHVSALELVGGEQVPGDLFLDCSGPAALLCEAHGFESWSAWLACDRVVERATQQEGIPPPYTHAAAHPAGWLRSVPLAGGPSEAMVFASAHHSDTAAIEIHQGRRTRAWHGNVIAIGAAAALVEPLYGHNLHLVHSAIQRLVTLFPTRADGPEAAEYNRITAEEADRVRDFVIAHYKTNARTGEPFWDAARAMSVPDTLQYKLDLYASRGRMPMYDEELFDRAEWIAMLDGQGLHPRRYDALADTIPEPAIIQHVTRLREMIVDAAKAMPNHGATLAQIGAGA
ncbi:tryptophan halogenase family protein [Sphingomonas soli]|uniref:tryptophan halogenase family protein n=1 Tax=Sphingomonas soli TaxID=266127 RepID=UPI00083423A2|nr:tryptophan halogenase family protein [Sphingomonas soli]